MLSVLSIAVTDDEADQPGEPEPEPEPGALQQEPQCSTWSPPRLSSFQAAASRPSTSGAAETKLCFPCPHCGKPMDNTHMHYKGLVYCESREGSFLEGGKTLEEWLLGRGVARTTAWRLNKRFWEARFGTLPSRKERICPKCGERTTRATGHTVLRAAKETFCSKSDPQGRSPEQWLVEKRGGVTEEQRKAKEREVRNARSREKRAQRGKLPRLCSKCGERLTRAMGHTALQRETFCSKSDPHGRSPEQWLAEKRGGITEKQAKARDVRNARAREKRAQKLKKKAPSCPPPEKGERKGGKKTLQAAPEIN